MTIKSQTTLLAFFILMLSTAVKAELGVEAPQPADVTTIDSLLGNVSSSSRRTFYDSAHGQHWVLYLNNGVIAAAHSADQTNWSTLSAVLSASSEIENFNLVFKTISGQAFVFVVAEVANYDVLLWRGVISSSSSLSFTPPVTVYDGTGESFRYQIPALALDSSNHVVVAARQVNRLVSSDNQLIVARHSSNTGESDLTSWQPLKELEPEAALYRELALMSQPDGRLLLLLNGQSPNIVSYVYRGGAWERASGEASKGLFSMFTDGSLKGCAGDTVREIAVRGNDVFVGGTFVSRLLANGTNIMRWDGSNWHALGYGLNGTVRALAVKGSDLYVGGDFSGSNDGVSLRGIARWDGFRWYPVGEGVQGQVYELTVVDDSIYVGGRFDKCGSVTGCNNVAFWDGENWNPLGSGIAGDVWAINYFNNSLYVGGEFSSAGGDGTIIRLGKWNGTSWDKVLNHGSMSGANFDAPIYVLLNAGGYLYIGGSFANIGDENGDRVVRYNGTSFESMVPTHNVNPIQGTVWALASDGQYIYVGGNFTEIVEDRLETYALAAFNPSATSDSEKWLELAGGIWPFDPQYKIVYAIASSPSGLYVGGDFVQLSGFLTTLAKLGTATQIATINESDTTLPTIEGVWSDVGGGYYGPTTINAVHYMASQEKLYVVGDFRALDGKSSINGVGVWDGLTWSGLGSGVDMLPGNSVYAIAMDDNNLYIGGMFTSVSGVVANNVARWNFASSSWHAMQAGVNSTVYGLYLDGSNLYVGGGFSNAQRPGVTPVAVDQTAALAIWNGSDWVPAGGNLSGGIVKAIMRGHGKIYIGGASLPVIDPHNLLDPTRHGIGVWNSGSSRWEILNQGLPNAQVNSLEYVDSESRLYVGGSFVNAGTNIDADNIAIWDGTNWNAIGYGSASEVTSVKYRYGNDDTRHIYISGSFYNLGGQQSGIHAIAKLSSGVWQVMVPNEQLGAVRDFDFFDIANIDYADLIMAVNQVSLTGNYSLQGKGLLRYSYVSAPKPATITQMSALADPSGDVHLVYVNLEDKVSYSRYSFQDNKWNLPIAILALSGQELITAKPVSLSLTYDPRRQALYTFIAQYDRLYSSSSASPYISWLSAPIKVFEGEDIASVFSPSALEANDDAHFFTISNEVAPFSLRYWHVVDSDGDGLIDHLDSDLDQDGLPNTEEDGYGTNAYDGDSDDDTILDGQELTDGSDPNDRGSNIPVLGTTLCAEWNGFLGGMWNVFEHVNMTASELRVQSRIYSIEGDPGNVPVKFKLAVGGQYDLLTHDMDLWKLDSYGKVCSTLQNGVAGDLDGRMVYYKESATSMVEAPDFEFAFAMPLLNGLAGKQFVPYNTYQPSLDPVDAANPVANWIQVTNLETTAQKGTLTCYGMDGKVVGNPQTVTIPAEGRMDFPGHDIAGGAGRVGYMEWSPQSTTSRFQVRNVRYLYDNPEASNSFDSAFQLEGAAGTGRRIAAPIDTRKGSSIVEISNVSSVRISAAVAVHNKDGEVVKTYSYPLKAHQSYHLIVDDLLPIDQGTVVIDSSVEESVIATVMQYSRTPSLGIGYLYGIQAKEALGTVMRGSYNTFLDQNCSLLLVNPTSTGGSAAVTTSRFSGKEEIKVVNNESFSVPAWGVKEVDLCVRDVDNVYGSVTIQPSTPNGMIATILRVGKNDSYAFPTPVRQ